MPDIPPTPSATGGAKHDSLHPRPTWLSERFYDLTYLTGQVLFGLGFSFRWRGTENVPQSGPLLVVANHQSFFDPWIVGMAVKRHLTYLARKTLFRHPLFRQVIQALNAVPIDQEGVAKEGLKTVVEQLRLGKAVLVFPEGTRTPDGQLHELQPGVHLIIRRAMPTILPVGIAGAYHAWPIWRKYPIPAPLFMPAGKGTIAVVVGRPIASERLAELRREEALPALLEEIRRVHRAAEKLRRK